MMAAESGSNLAADSWPQWQQKACHDGSRKLVMMAAESLS